uniref:Lipoprotein n=1 Tax=Mizugakiibacter sediminis TaxID=1475481 RepID=A0A0U1PBA7_9GAMM
MRLAIAFVLAVVLTLAGCATRREQDQLQKVLDSYAATLRWGDFEAAYAFVDPKQRKAHPLTDLDRARYRQVRVSDYDVQSTVPQGEHEVRQVVRISLINHNTQSERSIIDAQVWRYDEQAGQWWLESGLPDITR